MPTRELSDQRRSPRRHRQVDAGPIAPTVFVGIAVIGAIVIGIDSLSSGPSSDAAPPAAVVAVATTPPPPPAQAETRDIDLEGCTLDVLGVTLGDTGSAVDCAQRALAVTGYYAGDLDGVFNEAVAAATRQFQVDNGLYVDGVIGRRTAIALGIWPGDEIFIVRTPAPEPGTYDSTGYELSPVASKGNDAPPLPEGADQRTGKRIVYDRAGQRVWAIDDDERVVRSYLVSGSQFANERPGVYSVYSKSEVATGWDLEADLPYMIRYQKTDRGNIGFHEIPINKASGDPYQTADQLGEKLSGGCQRQHPLDALFLWHFADVGTTVVVT